MKKDITVDERIKEILQEHLGSEKEEITPTASLFDDLGADSLDAVEVVIAMEEEFEIDIPDEEAEEIKTVQQLIDCVTGRIEKVKHGNRTDKK